MFTFYLRNVRHQNPFTYSRLHFLYNNSFTWMRIANSECECMDKYLYNGNFCAWCLCEPEMHLKLRLRSKTKNTTMLEYAGLWEKWNEKKNKKNKNKKIEMKTNNFVRIAIYTVKMVIPGYGEYIHTHTHTQIFN